MYFVRNRSDLLIQLASIKSNIFLIIHENWGSKHLLALTYCILGIKFDWGFWEHTAVALALIKVARTGFIDWPALIQIFFWIPDRALCWVWKLEWSRIKNAKDPDIQECVLHTLSTQDPTLIFLAHSNPWAFCAAQAQDKMGCLHMTEGKCFKQWQTLEANHYQSVESQQSPSEWASGLVSNLITVRYSQWMHQCVE
jgi:hypothetical protein